MILRPIFLLAALAPLAFADVQFTSPAAGDTITGTTISIEWEESGNSPPISNLVSYQLFLCAGGNTADSFIQLAPLVQDGAFTTGNSASGVITPGLGAPETNAYFLKMISAASGGSIINYSDRFSLPDMTGVFPANVEAGVKSVTGTSGPPTQNEISQGQQNPVAGGTVAAGTGPFGVAYTLQTGPTRYAPMPPMAVTKITAKNRSPQWPTSQYVVYPTVAGSPNAVTTITQPLTFSASSIENTGAAAGQPTDTALAKFLNRWKD